MSTADPGLEIWVAFMVADDGFGATRNIRNL